MKRYGYFGGNDKQLIRETDVGKWVKYEDFGEENARQQLLIQGLTVDLAIAKKEIEYLKEDLRSTVGGRSAAGLALAGQNIELINENRRLGKENKELKEVLSEYTNLTPEEAIEALKEGE